MEIGISILDVNEINNLKKLNELNNKYLHLDIMDGKFVVKKTLPFKDIKLRTDFFDKNIDIHLMVDDVEKYIDEYKTLKPEYITFHIETNQNIENIIDKLHNLNIKVGLAIKPNTPINTLLPYLNKIDLVLLMSVEPGLGGQTFLDITKSRIEELVNLKKQFNNSFKIEVDGGIKPDTIKYIKDADIIVVGSYITKNTDYQKCLSNINEAINDCKN